MSLGRKVASEVHDAMKARDEFTTSCLRLILNALKNKEKDLRRPLTEAEEIAVMKTLAKQHQEAADQFTAGNRPELAAKEAAELKIVQSYLPAGMGEDQIRAVLEEVFVALQPKGPQDTGRVMKEAMARLGPTADGKQVNALVRARLA
jgi:hypothetical protein